MANSKLTWTDVIKEVIEQKIGEGKIKGLLASKNQHPEFIRSVENLAQKSGLHYVPHMVIMDEMPVGPVWARKLPNAGANPLRSVLVSKNLLEVTGSSLYKGMSAELETIMAHEFSHLKDGAMHNLGARLQVFALPIIAMAGLFLYDRAKAKTEHRADESKKEFGKRLTKNIHETADEEIEKAKAPQKPKKWHADPDWSAWALNAGRYALVAAVGLATGLVLSRHLSLSAEYRADKFAVENTGNPEIFKKILLDLENIYKQARVEKPKSDTMGEVIKEKFHWLLAKTIHAHPTTKERISAIDKITLGR